MQRWLTLLGQQSIFHMRNAQCYESIMHETLCERGVIDLCTAP